MARSKYTTRKQRIAHMDRALYAQEKSQAIECVEPDAPEPHSMDAYNAMRADPEYIEVAGRGHFMRRETFETYCTLFEPYAGERERRETARDAYIRQKGIMGNRMRMERLAARRAALAAAQV